MKFKDRDPVMGSLAECRKLKKITQKQLAEKLGISVPRLSAIERSNNAELKTVRKIASLLGCYIVVIKGPEWDVTKGL